MHDAVDARECDLFVEAARPEDFEFVDSGGGAEAKVEAQVGSRSVAGAAENVRALADSACSEEDFGADGIARGTMS